MSNHRFRGRVDQRGAGSFRARYTGPDGERHTKSFPTPEKAHAWLRLAEVQIEAGAWTAPERPIKAVPGPARVAAPTFEKALEAYLAQPRPKPLSPATLRAYGSYRRGRLAVFRDVPVDRITRDEVNRWYSDQASDAMRARCYSLLASVLKFATVEGWILASPCTIRRGSKGPTASVPLVETEALTPAEVEAVAFHDAMPVQWRAGVLLLAYCSLRWAEMAGLQRRDVDLDRAKLTVRRRVVRGEDNRRVLSDGAKSAAGIRVVDVPASILPDLRKHLADHVGPEDDAMVFQNIQGGLMSHSSFHNRMKLAGARPHLLRHAGQTWSAEAGADLRTLMTRAGQTTPSAALMYLHRSERKSQELAAKLGDLRPTAT